jgi:DNA processing protein
MNWSAPVDGMQTSLRLTLFEPEEQRVLAILKERNAPVMIDELSFKSELPPSQLASLLLTLEFKNAVKSLPGKMYTLR